MDRPAGHRSDGTVTELPKGDQGRSTLIKDRRPHDRHRTPSTWCHTVAEPFPTQPYGTSSSYNTTVGLYITYRLLRRFVGEPVSQGSQGGLPVTTCLFLFIFSYVMSDSYICVHCTCSPYPR